MVCVCLEFWAAAASLPLPAQQYARGPGAATAHKPVLEAPGDLHVMAAAARFSLHTRCRGSGFPPPHPASVAWRRLAKTTRLLRCARCGLPPTAASSPTPRGTRTAGWGVRPPPPAATHTAVAPPLPRLGGAHAEAVHRHAAAQHTAPTPRARSSLWLLPARGAGGWAPSSRTAVCPPHDSLLSDGRRPTENIAPPNRWGGVCAYRGVFLGGRVGGRAPRGERHIGVKR